MSKRCMFFCCVAGNGHTTQAIALKEILDSLNIEICGLGHAKTTKSLEWIYRELNISYYFKYYSPNFVYLNGSLSLIKTVLFAICNIFNIIKSIFYIRAKIKKEKPDFIVNFYEPLIGLAAVGLKVPVISIAHQFFIDSPSYPKRPALQKLFISFFNKIVGFNSKKKLALNYYPAENFKGVEVAPPLLRKSILSASPTVQPGKLVAYVVNSELVFDLLINVSYYHAKHSLNSIIYNEKIEHNSKFFTLKKVSSDFVNDLLDCEYVVCSGGFETICESILLGKKILAVPVKNHGEQILNTKDAAQNRLILTNNDFNITELLNPINFNNIYTDFHLKQSKEFIKTGPEFFKTLFSNL